MAVLVRFDRVAPASRGIGKQSVHRLATECATLVARGWDTAVQIAVFVWMALVVALFAVIAAGFLLA
jgi:hypothetical protein